MSDVGHPGRRSVHRALLSLLMAAAVAVLCATSRANAQSVIDLRLVGPTSPVVIGNTIEVKLRAQRQDPALAAGFVAIDCIVGWNPAHLRYLGITATGSVPLLSSYLPSPTADYTGINEASPPADGTLLYYALAPIGAPISVPAAGVQVVTFRFQVAGSFTSTAVSVIDNLNINSPTETIVYDGVVPGLDDFGVGYAATITQLDCSTIYWYRDQDGDGAGDPSISTTGCAQPAGYVSNANDGCPTDAAKTAPGGCGCGVPDTDANGDGNPDCFGQIAALSLAADSSVYGPGASVLVRVGKSANGTGVRAADLGIRFDAARLELLSATPVAGSAFAIETAETIDNTAGSLRYGVSLASSDPANTTAAPLVDLAFRVRSGASACGVSGLVWFGSVGGTGSRLTTTTTVPMVPVTTAQLPAVTLLSAPPTITGAPPAAIARAADAGTTLGAFVAQPTVTATNSCGAAASLALAIAYPSGATASSWPANGMFPVGTTTVTWTATDAVGQVTVVARTIAIDNAQLMDIAVSLVGSITQSSTRTMRVRIAGMAPQLYEVQMTGTSGAISGVRVPIATAYPCVSVKDVQHSVTKSAPATVSAARYAVAAQLRQGDSNDDDFVDVLDFGVFVGNRGVDLTRRGPSNFNSDQVVSNADFAFIAVNFLATGDSCGALAGGAPRARVTVRELRRNGLGHLAKADLNGDGWVDARDVELFARAGG